MVSYQDYYNGSGGRPQANPTGFDAQRAQIDKDPMAWKKYRLNSQRSPGYHGPGAMYGATPYGAQQPVGRMVNQTGNQSPQQLPPYATVPPMQIPMTPGGQAGMYGQQPQPQGRGLFSATQGAGPAGTAAAPTAMAGSFAPPTNGTQSQNGMLRSRPWWIPQEQWDRQMNQSNQPQPPMVPY